MTAPLLLVVESDRKARDYVEALMMLGVEREAVRVATPVDRPADARAAAAEAAGVVLCGGPDVDPERYGETRMPEAALALYPELDELEWEVAEGARAERVPVWAICRGLQMINVFLGGTLWQDLLLQKPGALDHRGRGPVDRLAHGLERVDTGSELGATLAGGEVQVNTRHHQGIRKLAPGLTPVAYAPDGVLETIEDRSGDWWLRGVQWHPENLTGLPVQRRLWRDFLAAAARHAGRLAPVDRQPLTVSYRFEEETSQ